MKSKTQHLFNITMHFQLSHSMHSVMLQRCGPEKHLCKQLHHLFLTSNADLATQGCTRMLKFGAGITVTLSSSIWSKFAYHNHTCLVLLRLFSSKSICFSSSISNKGGGKERNFAPKSMNEGPKYPWHTAEWWKCGMSCDDRRKNTITLVVFASAITIILLNL